MKRSMIGLVLLVFLAGAWGSGLASSLVEVEKEAKDRLEKREYSKVVGLLEPYWEEGKRDPELGFMLGKAYFAVGSLYRARMVFSYLISSPGDHEISRWAFFYLGEIDRKEGRLQDAIKHYLRGLWGYEKGDLATALRVALADTYYELGDKADSWLYFKEALDKGGDEAREYLFSKPRCVMELASLYYSKELFGDSYDLYRELTLRYPHGSFVPGAFLGMGDSLLGLGRTEDALFVYARVVSNYPRSREAWLARLRIADVGVEKRGLEVPVKGELSHYYHPLDAYRYIAKSAPYSDIATLASLKLAEGLLRKGGYGEAAIVLKMALITGDPFYAAAASTLLKEVVMRWVGRLREMGEFVKVVGVFEEYRPYMSKLQKKDCQWVGEVAKIYERVHLDAGAEEIYDVLVRRIGCWDALVPFVKVLVREGKYAKAEEVVKGALKGLKKGKNRDAVVRMLANIKAVKGECKEALDLYKTIKKSCLSLRDEFYMAGCMHKLGKKREACSIWSRLSNVPGDTYRKNEKDVIIESILRSAKCYTDSKKYNEAIKVLDKGAKLAKDPLDVKAINLVMAGIYGRIGDIDKARLYYEKVLSFKDNSTWREMAKASYEADKLVSKVKEIEGVKK